MTGDGWSAAVRRQLGLGRVLPLGGPGDGAWLTESAAAAVLRRAAERVTGARLLTVRLALADPAATAVEVSPDAYVSTVPSPPSALPHHPLRISGDVAADATEPLPVAAARLRTVLAAAAADRLGLVVAEVDLRVTALLDGTTDGAAAGASAAPGAVPDAVGPTEPGPEPPADDEDRVARAALAVPGVTRLTGALGGLGRAVHIEERPSLNSLPRRHVRLELAVSTDHRALDVTRAVRTAVGTSLPDRPSVAVLVTAVD
ncbi:nucleopolyhedrovirus P10 family protein [Streptomyces sp. NPDC059063]|uniref:nucleopolyhedrovirus P10 family protein n=1 Tax=unclassified Streptomyces TaxID=2593676 RepID=UPI0036B87C54